MKFNLDLNEMHVIKTALTRLQESGMCPNNEINIAQDLAELFDMRIKKQIWKDTEDH